MGREVSTLVRILATKLSHKWQWTDYHVCCYLNACLYTSIVQAIHHWICGSWIPWTKADCCSPLLEDDADPGLSNQYLGGIWAINPTQWRENLIFYFLSPLTAIRAVQSSSCPWDHFGVHQRDLPLEQEPTPSSSSCQHHITTYMKTQFPYKERQKLAVPFCS